MPSRYMSALPERKITAPASKKTTAAGSPTPAGGAERTAKWPAPGKGTGAFAPRGAAVVKTHPVKAGVSGGLGATAFARKKKKA